MVVRLIIELGLHSLEQVAINNGLLFTLEGLTLKDDLADIEAITKKVGERTASEGNAAHGLARLQGAGLADDAAIAQFGHQQVQAAKLQIKAENGPGRVSVGFIDGDPSVLS